MSPQAGSAKVANLLKTFNMESKVDDATVVFHDEYAEKVDTKHEFSGTEAAEEELNRVNVEQLSKHSFSLFSKTGFRLMVFVFIQGISEAAYAVDGSTISSIVAIKSFQTYFDVQTSGPNIGIVIAAISIGNAVASNFQFLADIIGRRGMSFAGNAVLILGVILQSAAPNRGCLIAGRLVSGMGASWSATVAPLYLAEVAPPSFRGAASGLACACYNLGSIVIACVIFGSSYIPSNWAWKFPLVFQVVPPLLVCICIYPFSPESPRFLYAKGKHNEARKVIARYHTTSEDLNDPVVDAEIEQIRVSLASVDKKPWDYTPMFKTKSDRRRLWVIFLYSFYQQWNGSGMTQYFLPGILTLVGITSTQQQLGINIGMVTVAYISASAGSFLVDRVRRRVLLIGAMAIFSVFFGIMALFSGLYAHGIAKNATGILLIVSIFIFNFINGLMVNTLHNIYPSETLHYSQRAKGMGLYSFFQNCFAVAMSYGMSTALEKMGWTMYFVFVGIDLSATAATWLWFPEYLHLTLEEIDLVYEMEDKNPVTVSKALSNSRRLQKRNNHVG